MRLEVVSTDHILVEDRARKEMGDIDSLADSIKRLGLIQTIAVKDLGDGKYKLLGGERRFRSCQMLGEPTVPVRVYPKEITKQLELEIEKAENVDRLNMTIQEELELKLRIHRLSTQAHGTKIGPNDSGWSVKDTANAFGESDSNMGRDLKLAEALEVFPELGAAKTKAEMTKLVDKLTRKMQFDDLAEEFHSKQRVSPDIAKQKLVDSYIVGDGLEGLKKVESGTIKFIDFDPPWGIDFDKLRHYVNNPDITRSYTEIYKEAMPALLEDCFTEFYRMMAPDSWLTIWFGFAWYQRILDLLDKIGFKYHNVPAIWHKPGTGHVGDPKTQLAISYEQFIYARKGNPTILTPGLTNVLQYNRPHESTRIHPNEKPIPLMEHILRTFVGPGSPVFSPFLGSGNVILAAHNLGMPAFGYDLSQDFKNAFTVKVMKGELGKYE